MDIRILIENGLKCPKCEGQNIRACGLEDTVYSAVDHFVCQTCNLRFMLSHNPIDFEDIEQWKKSFLNYSFWVLTYKSDMYKF